MGLTLFQFLVLFVFGVMAFQLVLIRIIEPIYVLVFNKPLFLHFYIFPRRLKASQQDILKENFSFYNRLSQKKKRYFEHRVKAFLRRYEFIGKEVEITDSMKILIAGTYVMLTFGFKKYLIDLFSRIIIYPTHYYSTSNDAYHKGEFNLGMKVVVFSWEDFVLGHTTSNDNINLGLHEFAHVLHFNGLKSNDSSAAIFYDEFNKLMEYYNIEELNAQLRVKSYFRLYAYTNQFEFLAVILEHFFETPEDFKKNHPELFKIIVRMINYQEAA